VLSLQYVHVECLNRWRKTSPSNSAFFACPQCHYKYRFARTQIAGLAANTSEPYGPLRPSSYSKSFQVIVGSLSAFLFTLIVMAASFVTTFFMSSFEAPTTTYSFFYISPFEVAQDLITAAFRIIRDGDIYNFFTEPVVRSPRGKGPPTEAPLPQHPPGIIMRLIRRFLIGLPLVGAGSIVHMLLSLQMLAPVQFVARYRASQSRRNNNTKDIAALIVIALVIAGIIRYFFFCLFSCGFANFLDL
jgi:hypothetical protein